MVYLFFTVLILVLVAYFLNDRELVAPSFLFSLSFFLASFFALINDKKWNIQLGWITYQIISFGIIEFILVCYIVKMIFKYFLIKRKYNNEIIMETVGETNINNSNFRFKLFIIEFLELIFIFIIAKSIKNVTGQTDIVQAINLYNSSTNGFNDLTFTLPTYVKLMQTFISAFGIFEQYIFVRDIIYNKRFEFLLFLVAMIGVLAPTLNGSRGGTIFGLITFIVFLYIVQEEKNGWNNKNNKKYILIGLLVTVILILLLQWSATLVGRNVDSINFEDYISTYIGAEIKNLDIFVKKGIYPIKGTVFGQQTFYTTIQFFMKHGNLNIPLYHLDLPYTVSNGYGLGNVYTTFYPWLYDFGYKGVVILTLIMAFCSELIYEISKTSYKRKVSIFRLFYGGTIAPCIVFSFFSNKFYESLDIIYITISIIIWIIANYFFKELR